METKTIEFADFLAVDMRVGTVIEAKVFEEAKKPALQLWINFGDEIGVKKTSAQITHLYQPEQLIGRQLVAVVNFPAKQIGKFRSEVLVLGAVPANDQVVLLSPDHQVANGVRIS